LKASEATRTVAPRLHRVRDGLNVLVVMVAHAAARRRCLSTGGLVDQHKRSDIANERQGGRPRLTPTFVEPQAPLIAMFKPFM
jgi:hypothetical protein